MVVLGKMDNVDARDKIQISIYKSRLSQTKRIGILLFPQPS